MSHPITRTWRSGSSPGYATSDMAAGQSVAEETLLRPKLPLRLGRFTLCEELGSGGMATVYLSRMELAAGLERLVALKTIHPHLAKEKPFAVHSFSVRSISSSVTVLSSTTL